MKTYVVKIADVPLFVKAIATYSVEYELPLGVPLAKEWTVSIKRVCCEKHNIKRLLKPDIMADIAQNIIDQEEQSLQDH